MMTGTPMISAVIKTLSRVPLRLRDLVVCVACEECFDLGDSECPACGSTEHTPLPDLVERRVLNLTGLN
jgi:hypothetical protein